MQFSYVLFYVDDVKKSMEFYQKAFLVEPGFLHESHQYGELNTGATRLGFVAHETASSHGFNYKKATPSDEAFGFELGFVSENVKESYELAIREGAVKVSEPKTKPWGQEVSYVRDINGYLIEICSAMS